MQGKTRVALGLGFLRGPDEVHAAQACEVAAELALAQQGARLLPFGLAAFQQLVVGAAAAPRREHELLRQRGRRPAALYGGLAQHEAIEPAEDGLAGVGPMTSRTGNVRHRIRGQGSAADAGG